MTLLQAWGDSLTLLKPKNFKLFMLVTFKSIFETYTLLFKYWWWLYLLSVVFFYNWKTYFLLDFLLYSVRFFSICVATRPSVAQKNCAYFRLYSLRLIPIVAILFFMVLITVLSYPVLAFMMLPIAFIFYPPLGVFTLLFFLDSDGAWMSLFRSVVNAVKMVFFNAPLFLIFGGIYYGISYFVMSYLYHALGVSGLCLSLLVEPIGVCFFANIYIKKLHDQFDLYFPQPK